MSENETLTETDEALNAIDHSIMLMKRLALKTRNIEYDEALNKTKYYGHSNFEEVNIYGKPVALKEDIQNIKTDMISRDFKKSVINETTGEEEEITETKTLNEILDNKSDIAHTHTLSDITNYITPVNTITYDSSTMSLNSIFNSINDNSITMINDYPNKFWMSALFRLGYSRSFAIAVTKYSYYHKWAHGNSEIRVYFNEQNSDTDAMLSEAYHTLIDSNNYSNYCAKKSHTHTLSDITDYAAPDLSQYALKSEIPDISGKANVEHTHTLSDITDYTAPDLSPYAKTEDLSNSMTTKSLVINSPETITSNDIDIIKSNLESGKRCCIRLAKDDNNYATIQFQYHEKTGNTLYLGVVQDGKTPTMAMNAKESLTRIWSDILCAGYIHSTSTITGTNIKSDNETRLSSVESSLTTKAEIEHTHTLSDITDYTAPDLSQYALKSEIPESVDISGKADIKHTHTASQITDFSTEFKKQFDQTYEPPDLTIYAKSNDIANSITTKKMTIKTQSNDGFAIDAIYDGKLAKNTYFRYSIGDKSAKALVAYGHDNDNASYMYLKLYQKAAQIMIYSNNIKLVGATSCDNTITATNLSIDNETRLATCESSLTTKANVEHTHETSDINNLETYVNERVDAYIRDTSNYLLTYITREAFKVVYPVGSVYMSFNVLEEVGARRTSIAAAPIQYSWNGCCWIFMESGQFLRNGSSSFVNGILTEQGSETTGGEETHTLTINEMPSHTHEQRLTVNEISGSPSEWNKDGSTLSGYSQGVNTYSTGGGQPHNNLPPYTTVYMYRRVE